MFKFEDRPFSFWGFPPIEAHIELTRKWGRSYDWVYRFVAQRDGEQCYICNSVKDRYGKTKLIVEHKDNDPDNFDPKNLGLAHRSCNTKKDPANQFPRSTPLNEDRERNKSAPRTVNDSANEGRKHDLFRGLWNDWIPLLFSGRLPEENFRLHIPEGGSIRRIKVDDLADLAVTGIARFNAKLNGNGPEALGTAQTWKKYIFEDRYGKLNVFTDDKTGEVWAELREQSYLTEKKIEGTL